MPYSFIDIEQQKSRVINGLFVAIILFYFLTAYLILFVVTPTFGCFDSPERICGRGFPWPSVDHIMTAFVLSVMVGFLHWHMSTTRIIERLTTMIGARPFDSSDLYHQYFKNIVDEVSVAIGGRRLEAWVIPSASLNAFALEDFDRRAVIGITEGALARLSRAQIEAVVGHEAGHIINGDCLSTTVTSAVAEIYEEGLKQLSRAFRHSSGRTSGSVPLAFVYLVMLFMQFLSTVLRCFVSREREYRADATAVRLTRDPLSLAEALRLISRGWTGDGAQGERIQSIFIVPPLVWPFVDNREGFFADFFSTHPPMHRRLAILLDMAHLDESSLEQNLKDFKRVAPVAQGRLKADVPEEMDKVRWFVFMNQQWAGPYTLDNLKEMKGLLPDQWVRRQGADVTLAYEDESLRRIFAPVDSTQTKTQSASKGCPYCGVSLVDFFYEGARIRECPMGHGALVDADKMSRLFIRRDKELSPEAIRMAELLIKAKEKVMILPNGQPKNSWIFDCPACQRKMLRQFYNYSYPVVIDKCVFCGAIWFDQLELEIVQYLYEHRDQLFDRDVFQGH